MNRFIVKKPREKKSRVCYWILWFTGCVVLSATIFFLHMNIELVKNPLSSVPTTDIVIVDPVVDIISKSTIKPSQIITSGILTNSKPRSKFAYVTLISGVDSSLKYRGFFYNTLLMKKSLLDLGSKADFIVLLGFDDVDTTFFAEDAVLFRKHNIIMYMLPRFVHDSHGLSFAEMALLKITPWSFTHYDKVQFLDGDVMPTRNMDCFFNLSQNTFTVGAASPLNSGWYMAIPNRDDFIQMRRLALWRLARDWDKQLGWADPMPLTNPLYYRGGKKACRLWDFNGADMDQGLLCHFYVLNHGNALLIDTDTDQTRYFKNGLLKEPSFDSNVDVHLSCCEGRLPTSHFLHFTGQSKPWVKNAGVSKITSPNSISQMWMTKLKQLNLTITDCVLQGDCKSPLGYWNRDFPKGGFKTMKEEDITDYVVM